MTHLGVWFGISKFKAQINSILMNLNPYTWQHSGYVFYTYDNKKIMYLQKNINTKQQSQILHYV